MGLWSIRLSMSTGVLRVLVFLCLVGSQAVAFGASGLSVPGENARDHLTFGVYAHVRSTEVLKKFSPIIGYLNSELARRGIESRVRMKIYPSYQQAIEALVAGEADFVRYGPVSYILAKMKNPGIRLLAMESNAGKKFFSGVIVVPKGSPLRSVEELEDGRIAFGNRHSTTGRYLAQAALTQAGLKAADFSEHTFLGRHDKVAFAVASGNYDAGAINENTFNKYRHEKGLRAILRFPCITKPWVARQGLSTRLYESLREILIAFKDPVLLAPLHRDGFLVAKDSEYDTVREAMGLARQFDEKLLSFATYASERPARVFNAAQPILDQIEEKLEFEGWHVRFRTRIFATYAEAIDSIAASSVDLARLGPASYILASNNEPEIPIIAQEVSLSGRAEGVFVVRDDAPIETVQDLRGKSVAFGNEHSTAGRYLSQALLVRFGLRAGDLKSLSYLGRHDKVAFAVAAGNYDAGVLRSTALKSVGRKKMLRPIARFAVPEKLWVARKDLSQALIEQLRAALVSLEQRDILEALDLTGFVFPTDEDYERVRKDMALAIEFRGAP